MGVGPELPPQATKPAKTTALMAPIQTRRVLICMFIPCLKKNGRSFM
jgi:hypothetical protein